MTIARLKGRAIGLAVGVLVAGATASPAQVGGAAAVPVVERFDRLANRYQPVVLIPLPPTAAGELQRALLREGYDPGPVTGVVDSRTRSALRQLQIDRGLRITGLPDYDTVRLLGLALRGASTAEVAAGQGAFPRSRASGMIVIGPSADTLVVVPDSTPVAPGLGAPPAPAPPPRPTPGVDPAPDPPRASRLDPDRDASERDRPAESDESGVQDLPGDPDGGDAAAPDTGGRPPGPAPPP